MQDYTFVIRERMVKRVRCRSYPLYQMLNIGVIRVPPASTLVLHPEPTLQSPVCKSHTSVSIHEIAVIAVDQGSADVFTTSILNVKKTRLDGVNRVLLIHRQKPTALTSNPRRRGKIEKLI
jgi:hypothetical protein